MNVSVGSARTGTRCRIRIVGRDEPPVGRPCRAQDSRLARSRRWFGPRRHELLNRHSPAKSLVYESRRIRGWLAGDALLDFRLELATTRQDGSNSFDSTEDQQAVRDEVFTHLILVHFRIPVTVLQNARANRPRCGASRACTSWPLVESSRTGALSTCNRAGFAREGTSKSSRVSSGKQSFGSRRVLTKSPQSRWRERETGLELANF